MSKIDEWRARKTKIIQMQLAGETLTAIAKVFGVSKQRIYQIVNSNATYYRWYAGLSPKERQIRRERRKKQARIYQREWAKKNHDKLLGYKYAWDKRNPDKIHRQRKKYYMDHRRERLNQQSKHYYTDLDAQLHKREWNKQRYIRLQLSD